MTKGTKAGSYCNNLSKDSRYATARVKPFYEPNITLNSIYLIFIYQQPI